MQSIRAWLREAPPGEARALMEANPSWVFFRWRDDLPAAGGPAGTLGAPLVPGRSVAVDRAHTPLGTPLWIATRDPVTGRRLERLVAWRCRALALPYGDQGLLISRALYEAAGGFRPLPLMEDVDLVRRLGRRRLAALPVRAVTSAERWRREGWRRRSARNLACLSLWFLGVPPGAIKRLYG